MHNPVQGGEARETGSIEALAPVQGDAPHAMEGHSAWPMIGRLPVMLAVSIPLRGLKVSSLLNLRAGQTVPSRWAVTEDVALMVGSQKICWGEFENVDQQMALRLTRLA